MRSYQLKRQRDGALMLVTIVFLSLLATCYRSLMVQQQSHGLKLPELEPQQSMISVPESDLNGACNDQQMQTIISMVDTALMKATSYEQLRTESVEEPKDLRQQQHCRSKLGRPCRKHAAPTRLHIRSFQRRLSMFIQHAPVYPEQNDDASAGVVIAGGGLKYLAPALTSIRLIRETFNDTPSSKLPIMLVTLAGEQPFGQLERKLSNHYGVRLLNLERLYPGGSGSIFCSYSVKLWSIALAPFQQVLLLDSDAHPAVPPTKLLDDALFQQHGAVFWPDLWPGSAWSDLLQSLGIANSSANLPRSSPLRGSHESGQVLIDRKRKWRSVLLSLFLSAHKDVIFERTLRDGVIGFGKGDKEVLPLALEATGEHFYKVPLPLISAGEGCGGVNQVQYTSVDDCTNTSMGGRFAGSAMAQRNPSNLSTVAVVHRNCLKVSPRSPLRQNASECPGLTLNGSERLLSVARVPEPWYYRVVAQRSWYEHHELRTGPGVKPTGGLLHSKVAPRGQRLRGCRTSPHGTHITTRRFFPDVVSFDFERELERFNCELAHSDEWNEYRLLRQGRFEDKE